MKTQPLVSILIPLYNQERYFKACIRSVEAQSYKNLEIIVVNDGSTDRSPQMAKEWVARDSRVKLINKPNEGTAFARRDGYLAATGEYVTFLDSDDLLPQNAIETMVICMREKEVDLTIGSFDNKISIIKSKHKDKACSFPVNKVVTQPELFDKYFEAFFRTGAIFPVMACAKMFRKSVIDKAYKETNLFTPDIRLMGEDLYFNMMVFPYIQSMYRTDKTVYIYRHGGGTFGFNKNFSQAFPLSDKRLELLDKYNYSQGYKPLFAEYVAFLYHHAGQLIYFKKADKEGVVSFIKQEISSRKLIPRLEEFYAQEDVISSRVRLLLDRDYDGMYDYACSLGNSTYGSLRFKIMEFIVKNLERLS